MTRRRARAASAALIAVLSSAFPASHVSADHDGPAADQAAREILEARNRANAAAQAVFDAESTLDTLSIELDQAERDLVETESAVAALRDGLAESAVRQFVGGTGESNPLFTDIASMNAQATAQVYTAAATESELVRVDDYEAALDELEAARDDIERRTAATEQARERHVELMAAAEAEVVRLEQIEAERLQDAEVQHALERRRAEQLDEERRIAAAAAEPDSNQVAAVAAAVPDPPAQDPGSSDSTTASETTVPSSGDGSSDAGGSGSSGSTSGSPGSTSGSSGSTSGSSGSTSGSSGGSGSSGSSSGSGSSGSSSGSSGSGVAASGQIVCPVAGPHGFADTWGAPRSGGRVHQGVDMIAAVGVPIVAVEAGRVEYGQISNGALVARHWGASGTYYFYGHFSAFEGTDRYVSKGEVIAYNGATGTHTPHLHFEIHPTRGVPINPYPYVRAVC
ncbi:MAG: peptidoglycan DD-metalloendopeptidase family protein [Ilumatobacter fluminis]|uniref:M23 family metallopeptidase n=1 Tax=Ilumatobacter fluminis TaxID=467091 RepID=UPI0032F05A55